MYSRWLSGLGIARNFASHSRSAAELAPVKPCSGSSSAPVETRPSRKANRIPMIAMRRICAPDFLVWSPLLQDMEEKFTATKSRDQARRFSDKQENPSNIFRPLETAFAHQH